MVSLHQLFNVRMYLREEFGVRLLCFSRKFNFHSRHFEIFGDLIRSFSNDFEIDVIRGKVQSVFRFVKNQSVNRPVIEDVLVDDFVNII